MQAPPGVSRGEAPPLLESALGRPAYAASRASGMVPVEEQGAFSEGRASCRHAPTAEVEVARITIASTTWDVTCVCARAEGGRIHFRVVDEYGGETLSGPGEWVADAPLPLGEFTDRFLRAWDLVACCRYNFETDVQAALRFFTVDSSFYPGLDALCRRTVEEVYAEFVDDRWE